jgi:hypothetical protein
LTLDELPSSQLLCQAIVTVTTPVTSLPSYPTYSHFMGTVRQYMYDREVQAAREMVRPATHTLPTMTFLTDRGFR